jgi:hypothetical protein
MKKECSNCFYGKYVFTGRHAYWDCTCKKITQKDPEVISTGICLTWIEAINSKKGVITMSKIKYTWTLMHGDAGHYDKESLTLTDEKDIAFFDYVISLKFERYDCEGLVFEGEKDKLHLIELYKNTEYFDSEFAEDDEQIMEQITDLLRDWDYIASDCTTGGFHFAKIQDVKRK